MTTEVMTMPVTTDVTPTQQAAWLNLAKGKNMMMHDLGKLELQAQGILLPVKDSESYQEIDIALAAYRKLNADMTATRVPFTNAIDTGIIQPLMAFEKRVKEYSGYSILLGRSLQLRKAETDKAAVANQRAHEISRFKAHVENEFFRVAAEYRGLLRRECTGQYEIALRNKLSSDTSDIKKMLQTLAVPAPAKFNTTILSGTEMMEVYGSVTKPNYGEMYADACRNLDTMFLNFDSDVANAEAAIAHNNQVSQIQQIEDEKKLAEEVAINTLITTSETVMVDTPKIKRMVQVVVVESEAWAKSVMAAFIVNMPQMAKYIRVKSWAKLSIGQMAEYLGKLASDNGTTFSNLQLNEIEK